MRIGLIAIAGVKLQTRKFIDLGITLPQFINRGQVIAQLPSLGLLSIAGATPDGVDLEYLEVVDVSEHAADPRRDFDLVALSTSTARAFDAYEVADAYRAAGVAVVIGGLHATVLPDEVAAHADAVVVGEGERLWPELIGDFTRAGKKGLKPLYREARPGHYDLAESPMPRFELLARPAPACPAPLPDPIATGTLHHRLGIYNRIPIQTSRGCPWDCDFCAASKLYGPRYRVKPVDRVLREIDAVRDLWRRPFIEFADDNTFVNRAWSRELLSALPNRDIRYFTETDISLAEDPDLLDLLYDSGCRQVLIGLESPRRESLAGIDRANWKLRQHDRYLGAIERIQRRGVSVCGCFIVGLEEDTPEVFDDIRRFVAASQLLEVQVTVLTPFPGTRLYDRLLAEDRLLHPGRWERCTLFDVNFRPRGMTVDELEEGLVQLWRDLWNAEAFAWRKRHYRALLEARRDGGHRSVDDDRDLSCALPTSR
jgi:radical SAM superfamily enzyme YgiQ (UPF0313 family)